MNSFRPTQPPPMQKAIYVEPVLFLEIVGRLKF
jgi:hypothetical protein